MNLVYIRKVGYGVRSGVQAMQRLIAQEQPADSQSMTLEQLVRMLLEQEIRQKTL